MSECVTISRDAAELFCIFPAPNEPLSWIVPEAGDWRATLGYLSGDDSDLVAGLEAIPREAKVDHV